MKNRTWNFVTAKHSFVTFVACLLALTIVQAAVAASDMRGTVPRTHYVMTPELEQVAEIIGLLPIMKEVDVLQAQLLKEPPIDSGSSVTAMLNNLGRRQKYLYLRQKQLQIIGTANLEVNATRASLESNMSQVQEVQAAMVEKRARTTRRNTIINFVSGGITKITGYSIALGGNDLPTNILEVLDGSVQCALSGVTMKELHEENRVVKEMPTMLVALNEDQNVNGVYPPHIWKYLNEEPLDGSGKASRREALSSTWQTRGMFSRHDKETRLKAGSVRHHLTLAHIVPQLLEDRMAMLGEVRSVVSNMHNSLALLAEICKQSYDNDPSFDWPTMLDPSTEPR